MSASKKIVNATNPFTATEIGKSGRPVTVSMITPLRHLPPKANDRDFVQYWLPTKILKLPELVTGSMCPALFNADGYDFNVQFKVSKIGNAQNSSSLAVTDIHLNGLTTDGAVPVDSSIVYPNMLLKLAIRASAVVGISYPAGWTINLKSGKYVTTLKVGDKLIPQTLTYGINWHKQSSKQSIIAELSDRQVVTHQVGHEINRAEINALIGKVQKPKDSSDSMSNPKVQKLVAKLYALPVPDEYTKQPEFVADELTKHGIYKGESWVRQTAAKARDAGFFNNLTKSTKRKQAK